MFLVCEFCPQGWRMTSHAASDQIARWSDGVLSDAKARSSLVPPCGFDRALVFPRGW